MLKLNDLKPGDIISINDEGIEREGMVVRVSREDHQALVNNGIQEFWYSPQEMKAIPLDEAQLTRLGFTREVMDNGMKYKKDSFRLVTPRTGDFSNIDMWWREDRRHFSFPLGVHELQNLHLDMTKIPLAMA
ncbi:hypothetical protein LZZ85_25560 [Terrimonas sp. NA20]|uniref:Uncharacterized protein n=1 Tax=Terrimonas ginsenosidimutans TaxID=2908004 RepID=A0ABS9KZP3_9BACT|nr:hypothetical protein [Terrimonas ginsenosidimutans]MCG2617694.1 hypothetical protein [Terrimonas ginsenosidimutans]